MGAQQILRAAAAAIGVTTATAAAAPQHAYERVAVIDLDGTDLLVREKLSSALAAAGLQAVTGDGIEDALAGRDVDRDAVVLADAMATAERSFGQLDCAKTVTSARTALPILAARQAGGMPVPDLPRAAAYLLLCADRANDTDAAMHAATMLRAVGGSPAVAASILAKYPEIDTSSVRELVDVDVTTSVGGAQLWVDFQPGATSPAHLALTSTEHVIAAASGSRRGSLIGTPIAAQPNLVVEMPDQATEWSAVAQKVASWHGQMPSPEDLGWVLAKVHARSALLRHGNLVEVWGHAGLAEPIVRLGADDGVRTISEVNRAVALLADRVTTWNEHAPDPDQPLLVETLTERAARSGHHETPTKWWVYATIGAAALAAVIVVVAHYEDNDVQRVELHYP